MKFTYPEKLHFKCVRCALCCGDTKNRTRTILILKTEAEKIAEKTRMCLEAFADGKCIFLNKNQCVIYAYRPLICRFYPFELKETSKGTYAFAHTKECPGIGKGKMLKRSFFEKLFKRFRNLMAENA